MNYRVIERKYELSPSAFVAQIYKNGDWFDLGTPPRSTRQLANNDIQSHISSQEPLKEIVHEYVPNKNVQSLFD